MDEPAPSAWPAAPDEGAITVEIEYAPDEYGRVLAGAWVRNWPLQVVLMPLVMLAVVVTHLDKVEAGEWWRLIEAPVLALVIFAGATLAMYVTGKRMQRSMPMLADPLTMTFGADRVWISGRGFRQELHYSALYGAEETREHILLMISNSTRYILPKRAIDPQALTILRQTINQGLPGKAKRRLKR
jgi:hypothetical protein